MNQGSWWFVYNWWWKIIKDEQIWLVCRVANLYISIHNVIDIAIYDNLIRWIKVVDSLYVITSMHAFIQQWTTSTMHNIYPNDSSHLKMDAHLPFKPLLTESFFHRLHIKVTWLWTDVTKHYCHIGLHTPLCCASIGWVVSLWSSSNVHFSVIWSVIMGPSTVATWIFHHQESMLIVTSVKVLHCIWQLLDSKWHFYYYLLSSSDDHMD